MPQADARLFNNARIGCALFFACPGIVYGLFTGRLPAIKDATGFDDGAIGLLLLAIGFSCLVALMAGGSLIRKFGDRRVLLAGTVLMLAAFVAASPIPPRLCLYILCVCTGFGMGLADVASNTIGLEIERRFKCHCMAFLHASYSFGGIVGAVAGSAFAAFSQSLFINAISILGFWTCLLPVAYQLIPDFAKVDQGQAQAGGKPPLVVYMCGVMALLVFAAEGSAGEWGSLLLHDVKGASPQLAALSFAVFSMATLATRLVCDRIRAAVGDFPPLFTGCLLALIGLSCALFLADPLLCLLGYGLMGIGLAPASPILFSRAGRAAKANPAMASAIVALLGYSGLLFFPPLLGFLAEHCGLERSLITVLIVCGCLVAGSIPVCRDKNPGTTKW